jgi:hypothetical protein
MWRSTPSLPARASLVSARHRQDELETTPSAPALLLHLVLDPVVLDRVLGQDEQQLVARSNGRVDSVHDLAADGQIVGREPAQK